MNRLAVILFTLTGCAAQASQPDAACSCTTEISTIELTNANDAGVLEGDFVHVLTYGCSPEGMAKPTTSCDRDTYTVICHDQTLHFRLADDHGVCTAQLTK
jgi:hypothetical protein